MTRFKTAWSGASRIAVSEVSRSRQGAPGFLESRDMAGLDLAR
jgi:hypothetical protein